MHFRLATIVLAGSMLTCAAGVRAGPVQDVSPERVEATLRSLPTKRAALGDEEHVKGLRQTEKLLTEKLREIGYDPIVQKIEWVSPVQRLNSAEKDTAREGPPPEFWNNLIVEIKGGEFASEVVLIGAHFDAVAQCPGADDNGTGTAALVELARVLRDHPMKRTVRLVFFNLEEIGLIGSRHHAATQAAERPDERIVAMVSLEMLGYFCLEEGCQKSPVGPIKGVFEPPTKGDTLAAVTISAHQEFNRRFSEGFEAGSDGIKITRFDFMPVPIPDILRSDHAPFLAQGVPSIMLTDTSNFRNPHYHKPTDTIETLDMDRYVRSVRGVVSATLALAEEIDAASPDADAK
ncbi:MAG: hypothetical protein AMXMBFR58_00780 [Phycisphaerae bacterium]